MRVTDVHVDGFGVWTELLLGDLSDRVTVIYGANEAGKTTLMQFMRTILYGFSPERRSRYLPPVHGGEAGGTMHVDTNRQALVLQRRLYQYRTPSERETLDVRVRDGASLSPVVLDQLLTGVDEPTFNNVFSVGLRELQELGTLDDTDAAELLYKLTTGLDRVSLVDVMRELDTECRQLLDPHDATSLILDLGLRREQLQRRVEELSQSGLRWMELESQRLRLTDEGGLLQQRLEELGRQQHVIETALGCHDLWSEQQDVRRQLEQLGTVPEVPASALQTLEELGKTIDQHQRQMELLKRRRREIHREVAMLPLNERLWAQAARIEALAELTPWIGSLQSQVEQLRGESLSLEARLAGSSSKLSMSDGEQVQLPADVTTRDLNSLRGPARTVREETQRLKQAQEEYDAARVQYDEMVAGLESALLDQGQEDLAAALQQMGDLVGRLRRRIQLQDHHDQMCHKRDTLRHEHGELLEEQVLSPSTLVWLGVPFVVGVMLVISGLVWSSLASFGWPVAILGLAGWLVAVVAKVSMERAATRELEQCERQLELLGDQLAQSGQEMETLDAQLPRSSATWSARLAAAEKELSALEELLPREANLQAARQRVQNAQRRLEPLTAAAKEARARWRAALRRVHLPETLSPQAVRHLADGNAQTTHTRRQLSSRREELAAREKELAALSSRIEEIALQVDLNFSVSDPHLLLQRLSAATAEQRTLYERRQNLRHEDRKVRREAQGIVAQLRKCKGQRRSILTKAGAKSEEHLRQLVARCAHRRELTEQLADLTQQLQRAVRQRLPYDVVERQLTEHSKESLQVNLSRLESQVGQHHAHLTKLHQQQGAVDQEVKTLLEDRRLDEARLELGCIEQRLHQAVQRWRVLAVTGQLLENVREIYETHRQPQTLKDASRYFQQLTDGQYVRIWTPLSDMSLRVDMASGESLSLDLLSCGTREAVFLSLRLALVDDFARRGIVLPLVLDDVLVNFDQQRARAAAHVLCQFAQQDHQVLMFTCHDHIVQLFRLLQVPIRRLPRHTAIDEELVVEPASPAIAREIVDVPPEPVVASLPPTSPPQEDTDYTLREPEVVVPQEEFDYLFEQDEEPDELAVIEDAEEDVEDEEFDEPEDEWDDEEPETEDGSLEEEDEEFEEEEEDYEEFVDEELDEEDAEAPEESDEDCDEAEDSAESVSQRFTWESPERWWDHPHNGGAAA